MNGCSVPRQWLWSLLLLMSDCAQADVVYLCRSYGGGQFWSNTHCRHQQALIVRMTTVPDGMPFRQQVELAEAARIEGDRLARPPVVLQPRTSTGGGTVQDDECAALANQLQSLEAAARQPQSPSTLDRLAAERRAAQSRRLQLRCR